MKKIRSFNKFLNEKHLHVLVEDQNLILESTEYISCSLDEKLNFMDKVKNSISKNLLGSFSNIKMIDNLVNKLEDLEKETITKEYDYEDAMDQIEIKIDEARRGGNSPLIKTLHRQRQRKGDEYSKFMDMQREKIKKGISLIEKVVGKKNRRDEYAKLKLADKDYEIAEFRYNLAKKKAADPEEITKLKSKFDKARTEVERMVNEFREKVKGIHPEESSNIEIPNIDPVKEKNILKSRKGKDLIKRKEELEITISNIKEYIDSELNSMLSSLEESPESATKGYLKTKEKVLTGLSNSLDAAINILSLYRGLGNNEKAVDNKLKKESTFTEVVNKINSLVNDGNDANSGTTKHIDDLFKKLNNKKSVSFIKEVIKKIS